MRCNKYLLILVATLLFSIPQYLSGQEYLDILLNEDLTYKEIVHQVDAHFDKRGRGKHIGYKQYLRWKYFARRNLDQNGKVIGSIKSTKNYQKFLSNRANQTRSQIAPWVERGPMSAINTTTWSSHIGRITNIAIDPNNDQHLVVTSPGGGVWKTINEGGNWMPLFDDMSSMVTYSALISHGNADHYFIGTSGLGLQLSTNGGMTWSAANGIPTGVTIYTLLMHPINDQILLAAGSGGDVYRSTDGGLNWNVISVSSTTLYDLEFKPNRPDIVFASGRNGQAFKSLDNGLTWASMSGPWASRSLMMAVTPDDPNYLYVLQEQSGGFGGLFLSTDSGATFTTQSDDSGDTTNIMGYSLTKKGGQAPRDMDVIVSPTNKNEVHVAGIMTFKSTNAGVDWTQTTHWVLSNSLPFVHADIDQLIYHGSKIYVASDGGVFISSDGGNSFVDKTTGLGNRQFYRIGASVTELGRVAGGSQDNGTGVVYADDQWYDFVGADGMEPIILNEDGNIIIASIQNGGLYKTIDGGNSTASISNTQGGEDGAWVTPLEKDPNMANTIYQAKRHVYKSTDGGLGWAQISDINPASASDNRIYELCIAPGNSNVIYAAYDDQLFKTEDGGLAWSDVTPGIGSVSAYNYINIHPTNDQNVIIAVSGGAKFLETEDGGATWTDITFNLPNLGSNSVVFDGTTENGIFVSLRKGVYYKNDNSTAPNVWSIVGTGLPNVNVTELEIVGNKLFAASYGRGLWETEISALGCALFPNIKFTECNSQGTLDPVDDTFAFSLNPTGLGLTGTYSISGDLTLSNIPYNMDTVITNNGAPFAFADGPINITIIDDSAVSCPKTIRINPPGNCFKNISCDQTFLIDGSGTYQCDPVNEGEGATDADATHSRWFSFTPIIDGKLTVYSCLMGVDTRLYIHTGDCVDLITVASGDDECEMSSGSNSFASRIDTLPVLEGVEYLIEWDNRWSSSGFDFVVEYDPKYSLEECIDYIFADVTNLSVDELRAAEEVRIKGIGSGVITTKTPGLLKVNEMYEQAPGSTLIADTDTCYVNDNLDWMVIAGSGVAILDNETVEIEFEVPAEMNAQITDLNVHIKLTHTYVGDLVLDLVSPDNTVIRIWNRHCGNEDNLDFIIDEEGDSKSLCGDDWRSSQNIYALDNIPASTFNVFDNLLSQGIWKIRIADNGNGDTGTVELISLHFKG